MAEGQINLSNEDLALIANELQAEPALLNRLDSDTRRRWAKVPKDEVVGLDTSPQGRADRLNTNLENQRAVTGMTLMNMPAMGQAVSWGLGQAGQAATAAGDALGKAKWYARAGIGHFIGSAIPGVGKLPPGSGAALGYLAPSALRGAGSALEGAGAAGQYILTPNAAPGALSFDLGPSAVRGAAGLATAATAAPAATEAPWVPQAPEMAQTIRDRLAANAAGRPWDAAGPAVTRLVSAAAPEAAPTIATIGEAPLSKVWGAMERLGVRLKAPEIPRAVDLVKTGTNPEAAIRQIIAERTGDPAAALAGRLGTPSDAEVMADMGKRAVKGQKTLMKTYGP